ncbi:hypothetical protein VII00023_19990 [Vibrio ichthyoenteri ATCC 700023]|uniref:Sulfate ABC transporter permease n=1 Tax=Vibrio ichthyoenteri ATCC 700023 TaxID=870968 RepID=F9S7L2_9VIBR|nr:hypothetical protein [Vibrio ichthyoenteri]EGU31242.1 hypothetical protein VII00023_19990 [Vibrio ichthyoenteri ATCC 700023]
MNKNILTLALLAASFETAANIEISENILVSGFGSTSWAKSDNSTPLITNVEISDQSCFDCDTTLGLQIDGYFNALHASAQVVKRPQDHWSDPELEWAYLGYQYKDLLFRAGQLRIPLFLYSEYYYVGHAYAMSRPPTEVYNSILGITAYQGFSLTWNVDIDDEKSLSITPFYGLEDEKEVNLNQDTFLELDTKRMYGVNMLLSGDNYRWNFSYLNSRYDQRVTLTNYTMTIPSIGDITIPRYVDESEDNRIELYSLGAEYEFGSTTLTAELQKNDRSSAWYSSLQYRIYDFIPYVVYGQQYNEEVQESSRIREGESVTAGVRYDLRYNLSLNAEWQYFHTEKGYDGAFIDVPSKPTAQLYTIMINFVF